MSRQRKPKLGQNFLSDLVARRRIVDALGDLSRSTVLEIGPGHGALTELLAPRARRLVAVELDRHLVPELRFRFRNQANVEVLEADILTVDLPCLLANPWPSEQSEEPASTSACPADPQLAEGEDPPPWPRSTEQRDANPTVHIIGNLPYYITSDILLYLFRTARLAPGLLSSAVLMMQREVAERIASPPGRRDFGLLSATAQMHASPDLLFTLGPESFSPPPEVESSVVRLRFHPRFAELQVDPTAFDRFLHQAFAQKRKTLAKNLRSAGIPSAAVAAAWPPSLDPQVRAEATSLEDLASLHRALSSMPSRP